MKIFISWSAERSQALAQAINEWLKPILHFAEPWLSTTDIQSGDRWGNELAKQLQDTNFGILCVTSDNINAPWLLFEAGALAKSIDDGRVIPLLLDLEKSDLSGPLTQFQAEKADKDGIRKLAESLNKAAPTGVSPDTLNTLFDALWPKLAEKIAEIPSSASPQKKLRQQSEVLEELVAGVRSVEMRVRDALEDGPDFRMRRRRRFHPDMFMEMRHMMRGADDPLQILMVASFFKDDAPWLYEIALETYRAVRTGDPSQAGPAVRRFKDAIDMMRRGPFFDMMGDSKMAHMMLHDVLEFIPFFEESKPSAVAVKPAAKRRR
jgi:TIR domain